MWEVFLDQEALEGVCRTAKDWGVWRVEINLSHLGDSSPVLTLKSSLKPCSRCTGPAPGSHLEVTFSPTSCQKGGSWNVLGCFCTGKMIEHKAQSSQIQQDWLANKLPGSSTSPALRAQAHTAAHLFHVCPENQSQVFIAGWWALHQPNHLPIPGYSCLYACCTWSAISNPRPRSILAQGLC